MILPPKATEAEGKDFGLHPVCTGPFKFTERVAQDHTTLDRYPGYWDNANIHFDRVIYQTMSDPAVELANLHTGNIDLAERVLPSDVAEVKKDAKLRIVTSPALGYNSIIFNLANGDRAKAPIGQSALLRQAFEAAIDRQALVDVVYSSLYQPTEQAVTPASPLYVKGFEPGPRDIDKAKALVKQSGVPTPIAVTLMVANVPDQTQLAEVIQSMVRDAGFEVKINRSTPPRRCQPASRVISRPTPSTGRAAPILTATCMSSCIPASIRTMATMPARSSTPPSTPPAPSPIPPRGWPNTPR